MSGKASGDASSSGSLVTVSLAVWDWIRRGRSATSWSHAAWEGGSAFIIWRGENPASLDRKPAFSCPLRRFVRSASSIILSQGGELDCVYRK